MNRPDSAVGIKLKITMKNEQQKSDSEWVRSLVETHAADLTRYAASILGDAEAAKDVVQDVFVRLWGEPQEEIKDHIRPWLFRVCRNRALDLKRQGGRMKSLTEKDTAGTITDAPGPASLAEQRDSHAQLMCLMRELPVKQQEVVRLKFQNGMSYKEIATVTELTVTNVGFLLHTALTSLRTRALVTGE